MQLTLEVKIPKVPLYVPAEGKRIIGRLIHDTMKLALVEISGRVSDEAHEFSDTGHLAQSFGADPANANGGIELTGAEPVGQEQIEGRVFSTLPYGIVQEEGRRPNAPINRAGIDAIGLWARRKLGLSPDQAERAKWAIATVIIRRGLPARHFAERGFNTAKPRVEQLFQILSDQMAAALVGQGGATGTGGAGIGVA